MNRTLHTLIVIAAVCLISACASVASVRGGGATRTFTGTVTRADWQTYREVPFDVPPGTERITIAVSHDGREQRTALDLGLVGPNGFRGWSGSNKTGFTLAATDATPSFSPGRIEPGRWTLLLGVPAIREGVTTRYEARITLERAASAPAEFAAAPIREAAGWYRGDFHSHTAHSDGSCAALSGKRVPCPAFLTLEAARAAGLDFIAVTDHNTAAQNNALRELQGYFDTLLIIPGEEVTTFYGHANAFGIAGTVEFRLGTHNLPNLDALRDQVAARGGLLSINHPGQPTGESCMGCGWNPPDAHPERIEAVEVINGSALVGSGAEGPSSGIGFWHGLLDRGVHATAIGGSDNHDAKLGSRQSPVGSPTTVVYARNLSVAGILEGVRSGRAFIDLGGSAAHRAVDLTATASGQSVSMGGTLRLSPGETGTLHIEAQNLSDLRLELVSGAGGPPLALSRPELASGAETRTLLLPATGRGYWVRLNIRDREGKLQVLTNPVYVEPRG